MHGDEPTVMRIGEGRDIHRLVAGRKLVLGGVEIPYEKGLEGWSDADVLVHAVVDALLGAAGLGDIGTHFPAGDARFKNVPSTVFLEETARKLKELGWGIVNIDATIMAERPKLRPFIDEMKEEIGRALAVPAECINIKAGTAEGMGYVGRGEGMEAHAVSLIRKLGPG
ncbi:MAG: 2-C-methyl-D-erythritol 2,4-cyclodiphosphate synthase [Thermaerobacter sp.]|jgi:2-C-methyl-D-erythritol 2,4-cyclodiphosphate synthase|nr:2-C-methyl-D-erythritol 2,4-cyclodiphosphate synthase [Candidatus Marsarchaeota archaeon]MDA8205349.1 2-C-methyl-D-erythritol 2,4-cyclodiphosphate synthase [Thermaerobacter sp.]